MLIGHKPVCAFWRFSGEGEWITNTSQGGTMSYENVPMSSLELAVKASKAAKAEYWACDIAIDAKTDKPYILECATAFAAFPYIRDWICQYLMWDFSNGLFSKPHVPLFSWEELGKINPDLLRTMRHIGFSSHQPSFDGAYFTNNKDGLFDMEKTELSDAQDFPEEFSFDMLKQRMKIEELNAKENEEEIEIQKINFNSASLTDLMTLYAMEEDLALEINNFAKDTTITDSSDLLELESISAQMLKSWDDSLDDMRIDLNNIDIDMLVSIKGVGKKLAQQILEYKNDIGDFSHINQLKDIDGIGLKKFDELSLRFKV